MRIRGKALTGCLAVLLLAVALLAAGTGAVPATPLQVMAAVMGRLGLHLPVHVEVATANVLLLIRLPRVCMGLLVGAGLALSGAALQGLFRNPLADPGLIGVSAGASLSAVLVIVCLPAAAWWLPGTASRFYVLNLATFLGACLTSLAVFRLSRYGGKTVMATLLLGGLAANALCGAFTGLITYTATNEQLRSITFWTLGSLGGASWKEVLAMLPFVGIPLVGLPALARSLNAFALGEAEAAYMGVQVRRLKAAVILLSTLAVGASVAVSGVIGFVGLVVPHILRTLSGNDHRHLLVNSALLGASLLTAADMWSRTVIAPAELPIGIVTALVGTPLFIALLIRQKKWILGWA